MRILVTGGAGYVGSHAVRWLNNCGHEVWVYDSLIRGNREAVPVGRLILGDVAEQPRLEAALREQQIEAVMHFAAFALVNESVENPGLYYEKNVVATWHLLEAMRRVGVMKLVFSSTTATYGIPDKIPIVETSPQVPITPYGATKLMAERMLSDYAAGYGLAFAALRYFNAAGATADGTIGEVPVPGSRLIPTVLQVALGQRPKIVIYGDDYDTPDGTCIRDYVHVDDLAQGHELALAKLTPGTGLKINLGTGQGYSVKEVIDACRKVTGHPIPAEIKPRRPGDPPHLIASCDLAKSFLGWQPQYNEIEAIVGSAWNWHKSHPQGYGV